MRSAMNEGAPSQEEASEQVIALVGAPNCGKTTLYNWLTGSRFKTVNYPGSTVEYSIGKIHERYGEPFTVMDTPGTYSLDPKSPDEQVTVDAIFRHETLGAARLVVSVADATLLSRQLFVTRQLIDAGFNVVLAVTMSDLLRERGEELDTEVLGRELGVRVVLIDGRLGGGIHDLVETIRSELRGSVAVTTLQPARWSDEKIEAELRNLTAITRKAIRIQAVRSAPRAWSTAQERTRTIDRFLLHPVFGLVVFVMLMFGLFSAIFWVAAPAMDWIDFGFSAVAEWVLAVGPHSLWAEFLASGVIASVAAVAVFIPQIFILFAIITVLEDSGYLARSATLIDRPLSLIGLGGRSFVSLLSGYACAVPAMMAARSINSRRERWLTLFVIPLMSCSARLPVYALLLSFLFHGDAFKAGLALAVIYFGSLVIGAIAAFVADRLLKVDGPSFFVLELPVYRRPRTRVVLRQSLSRTKNYVMRAGPAIFFFALIVWVATTFPNYQVTDPTERLQQSYAAQLGRSIEPVFTPMGGDWRTGVALISAFAAREVFVSSLAVLMNSTVAEDSMQASLIDKMRAAQAPDGRELFTLSSVIGLVLFFMIALQCLSTVVVAAKEAGGWRFALMQLAVFNLAAYVVAVAVVQGLRMAGLP